MIIGFLINEMQPQSVLLLMNTAFEMNLFAFNINSFMHSNWFIYRNFFISFLNQRVLDWEGCFACDIHTKTNRNCISFHQCLWSQVVRFPTFCHVRACVINEMHIFSTSVLFSSFSRFFFLYFFRNDIDTINKMFRWPEFR